VTAAVDLYSAGLATGREPLVLRYADGTSRTLPVDVWIAEQVVGDEGMLDRCVGATLDVGCGPGRMTVALGLRGLPALGVDIAPGAVRLARSRGALALSRSVFAALPGHGRWSTALLADGNVGIGGDPVGLLRRLSDLLAPDGRVVVEVDPPGAPSGPVRVRVEHEGQTSDWFAWAHVSLDHLTVISEAAGFELAEAWEEVGRWFAVLTRR
jgi:SAM-dependent methyltransferase